MWSARMWEGDENDRFICFVALVWWPDRREDAPSCLAQLFYERRPAASPIGLLTQLEREEWHDTDPVLTPETTPLAATALMHRSDFGWIDRYPRYIREYVDPHSVRWIAHHPDQPVELHDVALDWDGSAYRLRPDGWRALTDEQTIALEREIDFWDTDWLLSELAGCD